MLDSIWHQNCCKRWNLWPNLINLHRNEPWHYIGNKLANFISQDHAFQRCPLSILFILINWWKLWSSLQIRGLICITQRSSGCSAQKFCFCHWNWAQGMAWYPQKKNIQKCEIVPRNVKNQIIEWTFFFLKRTIIFSFL